MSRFIARAVTRAVLAVACLPGINGVAAETDPAAYVARLDEFPPADAGVDLAGELVAVDHLLRRGGLRLDGDFNEDRYRWSPTFSFMLLPYGAVAYHGATADLNDVPLGTRLLGRFLLPPEGDKAIAPPLEHHMRLERFVPAHNRAVRLEDDFSHAVRTGRAWKLQGLDREKGLLTVVAVTAAGEPVADAKPVVRTVDAATRIWKGNGFGTLDDLAAAGNAIVQANLTWAPGWANQQFHASDVWLDEASRKAAIERQREIHRRRTLHFGLPARIEKVEHKGGGNGIVTVTLLAGYDPEIYKAFYDNGGSPGRMSTGVRITPVEPSLRVWDSSSAWGSVAKRRTIETPPPGSSGIELDISTNLLLEGFRPGRYVRLGSQTDATWPKSHVPPEVRIKWHEESDQALYGPAAKAAGDPPSQQKQ